MNATAAPDGTLFGLLVVLAVGMTLLVPSLWFLFAVFKGRNPTVVSRGSHG